MVLVCAVPGTSQGGLRNLDQTGLAMERGMEEMEMERGVFFQVILIVTSPGGNWNGCSLAVVGFVLDIFYCCKCGIWVSGCYGFESF